MQRIDSEQINATGILSLFVSFILVKHANLKITCVILPTIPMEMESLIRYSVAHNIIGY